jgi:hypothetical protein
MHFALDNFIIHSLIELLYLYYYPQIPDSKNNAINVILSSKQINQQTNPSSNKESTLLVDLTTLDKTNEETTLTNYPTNSTSNWKNLDILIIFQQKEPPPSSKTKNQSAGIKTIT